jgi:hypothetical protein
MKLLTTKDKILTFNGNSKDSRIRKALLLTGDKDILIHKVIASNGLFDPDSRSIKRYAKAIKVSIDLNSIMVKVSD